MENALIPLMRMSVRAPRSAAEQIIALKFERDVLWSALALVAVINTFLMFFVNQNAGDSGMQFPAYFSQPLALFVLSAGVTVVYVHAMYWAGQALGGDGTLMDVLTIAVWFQALWVLAQIAVTVLAIAVPGLGAMLSLIVLIWGFWIFLNFLTVAVGLRTPTHAFVVEFMAFAGVVLGLGVLTALVSGFV